MSISTTKQSSRKRHHSDMGDTNDDPIWDGEGGPMAFQEANDKIMKVFQAALCDQAIQGKPQSELPTAGELDEPNKHDHFFMAASNHYNKRVKKATDDIVERALLVPDWGRISERYVLAERGAMAPDDHALPSATEAADVLRDDSPILTVGTPGDAPPGLGPVVKGRDVKDASRVRFPGR